MHAFIVPAPGASPTLDEIQAHCRTMIAGYKVPRSMTIIDAFPLSPAGKILKHELRARLRDAGGQ